MFVGSATWASSDDQNYENRGLRKFTENTHRQTNPCLLTSRSPLSLRSSPTRILREWRQIKPLFKPFSLCLGLKSSRSLFAQADGTAATVRVARDATAAELGSDSKNATADQGGSHQWSVQEDKKVIQHLLAITRCSLLPVARTPKSARWEMTVAYNWVLASSKTIGILFYRGL